MADHDSNEKWFEGKSSLFKSRVERVKADIARRKAGRKAIKGEDVKVEWEEQNGVWMGPIISQELVFRIASSKSIATSTRRIPIP